MTGHERTARALAAVATLLLATLTVSALQVRVQAQRPTPTGPQASAPGSPATSPGVPEWWSGGRYRIAAGDVLDLGFPFVADLNQTVTVQPDGYIALRGGGEVRAQGHSVEELRLQVIEAYASMLREPVVSIVLREFEKPFFVATGEVKQPGRFELRGALTVTQALALAGGPTPAARHSQVVIFRRFSDELVEVKQVNVGRMFARRDLSEDPLLRPGDTLFVPQSLLSRLKPFLPTASLGFFLNPFQR